MALLLLLSSFRVFADPVPPSWEEERLKGFHPHHQEQRLFDRERQKGERAYLEQQELWERERRAALEEHRKRNRKQTIRDDGPEYQEFLRKQAEQRRQAEEIRQSYSRKKAAVQSRQSRNLPVTPAEELGLNQERPRFDVSKRVLYGAPSKFATGGSSSGGGFSGRSADRNRFQSSGDGNPGFNPGEDFPPPIQDGDILPPPTFDDSMGDFPPPPPPMEYDGEFPPPPVDLEDFPPPPDFGDFPPPPPPVEF